MPTQSEINKKTYNRISNNEQFTSSDFKIKTSVPVADDIDYERGFIERRFTRKLNDKNSYVFEINKKQFSEYRSNPLYVTVLLQWRVSGTRDEIKDSNRKSLGEASKTIGNIQFYLPNLLQFSKPIDEN